MPIVFADLSGDAALNGLTRVAATPVAVQMSAEASVQAATYSNAFRENRRGARTAARPQ